MSIRQAAAPHLAANEPPLSNASRAHQEIVAHVAQTRHYCAQRVIYREGDAGDALYIVLSGHLKAECWGPSGKAMLVSILGRGDIFGELSLLDGRPRGATLTVLDDATLGIVPHAVFDDLLVRSTVLRQHLLELMSSRLRKLAKRCEIQCSAELSERLADSILDLTRKYGRAEPGGATQIPFRLSQQELGNLIGASRESVNKLLRNWTQLGMLSHEDGLLTIFDERALRRLMPFPSALY